MESHQTPSRPAERPSARKRGCLPGCLIAATVIFLLLGAAVAVLPMAARWSLRKGMTPQEIQALEQFAKDPVAFPDSWCKAEPWDEQLLSASQAMAQSWQTLQPLEQKWVQEVLDGQSSENDTLTTQAILQILDETLQAPGHAVGTSPALSHAKPHAEEETSRTASMSPSAATESILRRLDKGQTLSQEEWTSVSAVVCYVVPFLEETSRTVRMPRFDAAFCFSDFYSGYDRNIDLFVLNNASRFLRLQAYQAARAHRWDKAFASARNIFHLARRHEAASVMSHGMSYALVNAGVACSAVLAGQCPEQAALERHLQEMNRLDAAVNLNIMGHGWLLDWIALLREARREGYPLEIEPGKSQLHYFQQYLEVQACFPSVIYKRLAPGDPRRAMLERKALASPSPHVQKAIVFGTRSLSGLVPELFFRLTLSMPDAFDTYGVREKEAKARYDTLRLALAARLCQLRGQETTAALSVLVPAYLPESPVDPFSGKEYLHDSASGQFYSVGPDARDDKLRVKYDPTNGTVSAGDLVAR